MTGEDSHGSGDAIPETVYDRIFRLDGRRAVVIGAGSGIGREAALALAAHGAEVVCVDQDEAAAGRVAKGAGPGSEAYRLDLFDVEAIRRSAHDLGPVDVLVHTPAMNVRKRLLDQTPEDVRRVISLNLEAVYETVRAFGAQMQQRGRGSFIGIASIRAFTVEPGQGIYAATKAAMIQLLRTAAVELGPSGVRVNAIAPGVVETPLTEQIRRNAEWYDAYARKGALGRWAQASEIAGAVVYLAGDAASFVTGSCLMVDGGWTAVDGRYEPPP